MTELLEKLIKIRDMQEGKEKEFKSANWEQTLRYSPIINNVITYINEHYSESAMKNADIAEAVELSVGRLCVRFKDEVGITLSEYITECRISNAKRLLLDGSYTVYEVAMIVGFGNSTYFGSVCRDHMGVPPIQYCVGGKQKEI